MCSRDAAFQRTQPYAIGRKSPFERKFAVPLGSFTGIVIFGHFTCLQPSFRVAGVALRDMWTCLVTCRNWQAQSFCDVGRTCVAFVVAGAALWTCPSSFLVAGAAFQTWRVACFLRIALARLRELVTKCKFPGRRGHL